MLADPGLHWRPALLVACLAVAVFSRAEGHDVPNARIERSLQITLDPPQLRVDYEIVLAELTLAQDLRQVDGDAFVGDRAALFERYARVIGPLNARGLLATVDQTEVEFRPVDFAIVVEDHPRLTFRLAATIPRSGRLVLIDTNYATSEGSSRLGLRVAAGVRADGDLPPAEADSIKPSPTWRLTDAEERRGKRLDVTFAPRITSDADDRVADISRVPLTPRPVAPPTGLTRLLDRSSGSTAAGWLVTALILGMVHALQPGHGKTLVAAASLGGPDAAWRGIQLGSMTAACHLIGVVALAALLWSCQTDRYALLQTTIVRIAGFLIAAVGCFRVGRHLAGIVDDHDHHARSTPGIWSLGLAAGFLPCWDAVALIVLASSIGQLGWGLALLAAFSLGLAIVLIGVGWSAGMLRDRVETGRGSGQVHRWLGGASGLVLAAIGVGLLEFLRVAFETPIEIGSQNDIIRVSQNSAVGRVLVALKMFSSGRILCGCLAYVRSTSTTCWSRSGSRSAMRRSSGTTRTTSSSGSR